MNLLSYGWTFHINWAPIIIGIIVLGVLAYCLAFPLLIAQAAKNHGRSGILWFLFSLIISPLLAVLLLIALGDTDSKRKERWLKEEAIRNRVYNNSSSATTNKNDNEQLRRLLEQSRRS